MQRKFLTNLILIICVNLLIKPIYLFGVDRGIQNTLGSSSYGMYYALFNLSYIFSIFLDLGITNYNNRHIAQHEYLLTKYFTNISVIKLILSLFYFILLFIFAVFIGKYPPGELRLLSILLFGQIFNSYILYNRSNFAGLHLFKTDTLISVLDKVLMLLFCAPFLLITSLKQNLSIELFAFLQTFSFLTTALVSFYLIKKHTNAIRFKFNLSIFKVILKESYPYAILASLMVVYTKADTIILKEFHQKGNEEVGIYAAAYRLIEALNMIAILFAGLLYPIFSKMIKQKSNLNEMIKISVSLLVIPVTFFSISAYFYRYEIIHLLYKNHIAESSEVFGILIFSLIPICNSYIFGTLLTANGNIRLLNYNAAIGVVLNIVLNCLFVPRYGAQAAATISLITLICITIIQTYFSFTLLKINYKIRILLKFLGLIILTFLLNMSASFLNIPWVIKLFGALIVAYTITIWLKLLPLKKISNIIQNG